jgi:protein-disulfide isomerase
VNPSLNQDRSSTRAQPASLQDSALISIDVIQFGDYQCLDCGKAAATLSAFRRQYAKQIRFIYRHFPQSFMHPLAAQAAEAAECARAQGRFWQMHELLMSNQHRLELRDLCDYADRAGLDQLRFDTEMDEEVHLPIVQGHISNAIAHHVRGTPSFVVDGVLVDTSNSLQPLFQATEHAIIQQRRYFVTPHY